MKKYLAPFLLCFTLSLEAIDLDIDLGLGMTYSKSDGNPTFTKDFWTDSSSDFNHNSNTGLYTWIDISLNEKYFPKLYAEFTQLKTYGNSYINVKTESETINDIIEFIENQLGKKINEIQFNSRLTETNLEAYLYYEYFEKSGFPTLGVGVGLKKFDFYYVVTAMEGVQLNSSGGDSIPLLYVKSKYLFHEKDNGSSFSAEVAGKWYIFGDSTVYDYSGKIEFMTKYNKDTNIGLELGYKMTYADIKGDDIDSVSGYMKTSGVYLGLVSHFK